MIQLSQNKFDNVYETILVNKTQNDSTTFENLTTNVEKDSRIMKEMEQNPKIKILPSPQWRVRPNKQSNSPAR